MDLSQDLRVERLTAAGHRLERPRRCYGFALTKMNLPFDPSEKVGEVAQSMLQPFPFNEYPNLLEILTEHVVKPGYDYGDEFEYGLDLALGGVERVRGSA